jgi:hypothetical protein
MDVPAGTAALVAVAACLRAAATAGRRRIVAAGAAAGVALAMKYSMFPVAIPLLLAVWWGARDRRDAVARALLSGAAALAAFALLSPYTSLKWRESLDVVLRVRDILFASTLPSLSLATCVRLGLGTVPVVLALGGLVVGALTRPRATLLVAAFPAAYLLVLASQAVVYSRYVAVVAPFVAIFAGIGAAALGRTIAPRRPDPVLAAIVLAAALPGAVQSAGFDRLLARRDSRQLAGDWIAAHVPPGTSISVPNAVGYPNPTLPLDAGQLRFAFGSLAPALRARGLPDPTHTYPLRYMAFFAEPARKWQPSDRYVVTAHHPVVIRDWYATPEQLARLAAAGAREVARFDGFVPPIPEHVVFEPIEYDYVPLSGFDALMRPGPNLTIWEVPQAPAVP